MKRIAILCLLAAGLAGCRARLEPLAAARLALIPEPLQATVSGGHFLLGPGALFISAGVEAGDADRRETARLLGELQGWLKTLGWKGAGFPGARRRRCANDDPVRPGSG